MDVLGDRARADEAMRRSEERFRAVFDGTALGIAILDLQGRIVTANAALQRILGYGHDELVGLPHEGLALPEDAMHAADARAELFAGLREGYDVERRYRRKDGDVVSLKDTVSLVRTGDGAPEFAIAVSEDTTNRRRAEEMLRDRTVQLLQLVAASAHEASSVDDALRICVTHVCQNVGWPVGHAFLVGEEDLLTPTDVWHLEDPVEYRAFRDATMSLRFPTDRGFPGQVARGGQAMWIPNIGGDERFLRAAVARRAGLRCAFGFPVVIGADVVGVLEFFSPQPFSLDPMLADAMVHVGVQLGSVIQRKRMEASIRHHALHDALTNLPNRILFLDRLRLALARLERERGQVALLFVDVDEFKEVNDALGHAAGDQLLVALAERLRARLRPGDTVARLGGDEFTVLCEGVAGEAEAVAIAERLSSAVHEPFTLKEGERFLTLSVGIALADHPDANPDQLLGNADAAMYRAKQDGGGHHVVFDARLRAHMLGRRGYERALRRALREGEMRLVYQPAVSLEDGEIVGVEALVRWEHPERGLLDPQHIIPFAEDTGLIVPLGQWVLEESCRQVARWRRTLPGTRRVTLWVNLSSRQLTTGDLAGFVDQTLRATGLEPAALCLEITESLLADLDEAMAGLEALRSLGVGLAIDDFGTGYSSLSYLRRLPIVNLKLDRSLVEDLGADRQAEAIVAAVINLAHALGLVVVAEGVETAIQLEHLRALNCDCGQGFYFARPQSAEALEALLGGRRALIALPWGSPA